MPIIPAMNNQQAYFVTWATRNTRISERMIRAKVQLGEGVYFTHGQRELICKFLTEKIEKEKYEFEVLNVLEDHCHAVLWCANENELKEIMHGIKGASSFGYSRQLKQSVAGEGRQSKIWARSFSSTLLENEKRYNNAVEYVRNNHLKHNLPPLQLPR